MADIIQKYTLEEIGQYLFQCRDQIHLWHFQTKKFAEHKALGKYHEELVDLADSIVEAWQGHTGKRIVGMMPVKTTPYRDAKQMSDYLVELMTWIGQVRQACPYKDIQNILDDLAGLTAKTIYLLTLS